MNELEDGSAISVRGLSKKFGLSLSQSMRYGLIDNSKRLIGIQPQTNLLRPGEFWALKNISFELKKGEALGIMGVNGCGKTTTIGMILGLLKPTSGQVLINGFQLEKNRIEILQKINFISPYIELPKKLTVKQNLIVYGKLYSVKNLNSRIDYLVEELRLQNLLDRVTGELSSGQKNRISLVSL